MICFAAPGDRAVRILIARFTSEGRSVQQFAHVVVASLRKVVVILADSFTGTGTVQIFDADGNLIVTFCATSTGTRFE